MKNTPIDSFGIPVAITALLGFAYMMFVIVTAPDLGEKPEDTAGGTICIIDDEPGYVAFGIDYDELFPAGHKYGKDGEIITMDPLPDPAATPDSHNDHPVMPWIDQSLSGQSPPVLYWPAPKRTLKKADKPCTDRYKRVAEPGILALIGAALLAMGAIKWKK